MTLALSNDLGQGSGHIFISLMSLGQVHLFIESTKKSKNYDLEIPINFSNWTNQFKILDEYIPMEFSICI